MIKRFSLLFFLAVITAVITALLLARLFLWLIWSFAYDYLKEFYSNLWADMPESIRNEFLISDKHGLYHNQKYMKSLGPKKMSTWDINRLSTFADFVCRSYCKKDDHQNNQVFLTSLKYQKHFNALNATALGNIAYTARHHVNPEIRRKYSELLEQIKEHFQSFK